MAGEQLMNATGMHSEVTGEAVKQVNQIRPEAGGRRRGHTNCYHDRLP